MPYKRNYRKKSNGGYRRPGYAACGRMVYGDAGKALAIARSVKAMVNVEYKFHDVKVTSAAQATSPTPIQLVNIAIGDSGSQRDGNQLKAVGIYLKYLWTIDASATNTQVRVLLVHDKQTNGAIFTGADVLADVSAIDNIISPYNLDNKYRFRILYDRVHQMNNGGNQSVTAKKFIKLNEKLRYDNAAAAISSLTSSSYSLLIMSSESSNYPLITLHSRLRFVDN